jgi:hypothetical protein
MNVLREICFDARWSKVFEMRPAPVRPDHYVETDKSNDPDYYQSLE